MARFSFSGIKLTPQGKQFIAEMNKLAESRIEVGYHDGGGEYEDGTTVAEVAVYNELGTSDMPSRPFMKQSWENHVPQLKAACQHANAIINSGGTAQEACDQIGVLGVGIIQEEISTGSFAPNAPSTIRQKGSARPLIDTGLMRQSVNYVVKGG